MEFLIKAVIGGLVVAGVVTVVRGNPTIGALILGFFGSVISVILCISGVQI